MDTTLWIALGLGIVILGYGILLYNRLVALRHNIERAWANIQVLLAQRHDELPKLVEVCRRYMGYEQQTLERVMAARSRVADARQGRDPAALDGAEGALRLELGQLFAVAEAYPELRVDNAFRHLQGRITGLENAIADRREFYNEAVNLHNVRIEQFPEVLLANLFGYQPRRLLRFKTEQLQDPDLRQLFGD